MKGSRRVLYRRSLYIIAYWQQRELLIENYASRLRVAVSPTVIEILQFFDDWRPAEDLYRRMKFVNRRLLERGLATLCKHALLERDDQPSSASTRAMANWQAWNPAAGFFHFSTKDVEYEVTDSGRDVFFCRTPQDSVPTQIKRYLQARQYDLPLPNIDGEFAKVLLTRRTWRRFSKRSIVFSDLGTLLGMTWGVQQWVCCKGFRPMPLKTSPSGGALHPIEVYVVARRVKGLPSGIYHYAADQHRLELLRQPVTTAQLERYLAGQRWFASAAMVTFMTAAFDRMQRKYSFARAYRAVLLEAGHLCQTFCLIATWLGLAPFCTLAFADSRIEADLGIDGVTESVIYAAGVGTRVRNTGRISWVELGLPRAAVPTRSITLGGGLLSRLDWDGAPNCLTNSRNLRSE